MKPANGGMQKIKTARKRGKKKRNEKKNLSTQENRWREKEWGRIRARKRRGRGKMRKRRGSERRKERREEGKMLNERTKKMNGANERDQDED